MQVNTQATINELADLLTDMVTSGNLKISEVPISTRDAVRVRVASLLTVQIKDLTDRLAEVLS